MNIITRDEIERYKKPVPQGGFLHVSEMLHEVIKARDERPEEAFGFATEVWPAMDQAFKLTPRGVYTGTGDTGVGKSTFFLAWLLHIVRQDVPVGLISLEDGWQSMARKIACMIVKKPLREFENEDIAGLSEILDRMPFWFVDAQGPQPEKFLNQAIRLMSDQKGVRVVLLDHLDYVMKAHSNWQSESYVIGDCMRRFAGVSHQTNTAIMMVVHPKKTDIKGFKDREIGMDELKGSSSIKQESSGVFGLWRYNPETTNLAIRFQKIRSDEYSQNRGAYIRFSYNPYTAHFKELSTNPEWGNPK